MSNLKSLEKIKHPDLKQLEAELEALPIHDIEALILKPKKFLHLKYIYRIYFLEDFLKRIWFDCRSCGQCILSTTGFICPMRCPKKLRNGICGGSDKGMCEADNTKKCVWQEIYEGAKALDRIELLEKFQKPLDHRIEDTSSFVNMFDKRIDGMKLVQHGKGKVLFQLFRILFHIIIVRWRKVLHPSLYHQKIPHHYLNA